MRKGSMRGFRKAKLGFMAATQFYQFAIAGLTRGYFANTDL